MKTGRAIMLEAQHSAEAMSAYLAAQIERVIEDAIEGVERRHIPMVAAEAVKKWLEASLVAPRTSGHVLAAKALLAQAEAAQGMSARQSQDPQGLGPEAASPVANGDAPR